MRNNLISVLSLDIFKRSYKVMHMSLNAIIVIKECVLSALFLHNNYLYIYSNCF